MEERYRKIVEKAERFCTGYKDVFRAFLDKFPDHNSIHKRLGDIIALPCRLENPFDILILLSTDLKLSPVLKKYKRHKLVTLFDFAAKNPIQKPEILENKSSECMLNLSKEMVKNRLVTDVKLEFSSNITAKDWEFLNTLINRIAKIMQEPEIFAKPAKEFNAKDDTSDPQEHKKVGRFSGPLKERNIYTKYLLNLINDYTYNRDRNIIKDLGDFIIFFLFGNDETEPLRERFDQIYNDEIKYSRYTNMLSLLREIIDERIANLINRIIYRSFYYFTRRFVSKVMKLKVPIIIKTGIIGYINKANNPEELTCAYPIFEKIFSTYCDGKSKSQKKIFEGFLKWSRDILGRFRTEKILDDLFNISRLDDKFSMKRIRTMEIVKEAKRMPANCKWRIYASKDYMDYFKGDFSNDCSSGSDYAGSHLKHPGFFNIRIFDNTDWFGNCYCLFRKEFGVIVDRIQISGNHKIFEEFFLSFLKNLHDFLKTLSGGKKIYMARVISDSPGICRIWSNFSRKLNPIKIVSENKYDNYFYCFTESKLLYELEL